MSTSPRRETGGAVHACTVHILQTGELGLERHLAELDSRGYTVVPPKTVGLGPDTLHELRAAVQRVHSAQNEAQESAAELESGGGNGMERCYMVLYEDRVFQEALLHPVVIAVGETATLLHPPLPLSGVSIAI